MEQIPIEDKQLLRELAYKHLEMSNHTFNLERKRLWYAHDAGKGERPMILTVSQVAFDDHPASILSCSSDMARSIEYNLRFQQYLFEYIKDDHVFEPCINCSWQVNLGTFGVESKQHYAERISGNIASRCWEPPIKDLSRDLDKLQQRQFSVDRDLSLANFECLQDIFGDILHVRMRGVPWWTLGMTIIAIDLVGLETFLMSMCANPDEIHRLMAYLRDDHLALLDWFEKEQLLTLNNENDYIGSGSMGYTRALPQSDWLPGNPVRFSDVWGLLESQETSEVGPDQFAEFVFQYQEPIANRLGRLYYGCCEGLHLKWPVIRSLKNLKRVSISPWCNQEFMAENLGSDYIFSRKPNPTNVSMREFDETVIRKDIKQTLEIAKGCTIEFIMKDVHTLAGEPERLEKWVKITSEVCESYIE